MQIAGTIKLVHELNVISLLFTWIPLSSFLPPNHNSSPMYDCPVITTILWRRRCCCYHLDHHNQIFILATTPLVCLLTRFCTNTIVPSSTEAIQYEVYHKDVRSFPVHVIYNWQSTNPQGCGHHGLFEQVFIDAYKWVFVDCGWPPPIIWIKSSE